jgi:2-polyprenyl-6-methoxyphenol hydroxylase-like FAD-dependent oxidoreductase
MKNLTLETPVLIVGGGPVGLALAGDLGFQGVGCILIEKGDGEVIQPRMDMVGVRTMEYCRRWGIVQWVETAGYNRDYPQDCAWVTSLTGYELGRESFPSPRDELCPPQSPQKRERCPQNFFDRVLRRFAEKWPTVQLLYNTELSTFTEESSEILATIRTATGERASIRARYLVGCDGASSLVRQSLGIRMKGEATLTFTTNVIFRCARFEALHDKKPGYRFIFIGPEGTWATLVAINGRDEWRFSLVGDQTSQKHSEENIRRAIVRAVGKEFDFEILSVLPWVRRQLVADRYGSDRAFIAGDAAHVTSPTGGFGMNTGIQDAVNLSWKIAATLTGWGGPELLRSYELEQRPIAIRNVTEATGNLKRMLSPRIKSPPEGLLEKGPKGDTVRAEFGREYTQLMRREWFSIGIHLGYMYEDSPIIIADGSSAPPDEVCTYDQTARPGSRAPHVWLTRGQSTLDLFGRSFVLLRLGIDPLDSGTIEAAARKRNMPLQVVDIVNSEAEALYHDRLILVRPDGQVAWRSNSSPGDAQRIIDAVRGALLDVYPPTDSEKISTASDKLASEATSNE